jgi:hypothetical protein
MRTFGTNVEDLALDQHLVGVETREIRPGRVAHVQPQRPHLATIEEGQERQVHPDKI